MKIYFGLQEDEPLIQELQHGIDPQIELYNGDFQQFLAAVPADAVYLPFYLTGAWNATPIEHVSQVLEVPQKLRGKFPRASFILTGAALKDADPKTPEYEAEVFFGCLVKAMTKNNIASLAIWAGFFHHRLDYRLCIMKLQSAIAKATKTQRPRGPGGPGGQV